VPNQVADIDDQVSSHLRWGLRVVVAAPDETRRVSSGPGLSVR
jgi:hypothetical protein